MKVVILAGGLGTRLAEETSDKPKPMVEINGKPILWHIMKTYSSQVDCHFIVATGYKAEVINDYLEGQEFLAEGISAQALYTGEETSTGGRVRKALLVSPNERVMVTYGDGVCDIDIQELLNFHCSHGQLATVTAVRPAARFGRLEIESDRVVNFSEKPQAEEGWINGGYFVFEPNVLEYLPANTPPLEHDPLAQLARDSELMAYRHYGFWQPMDTLREKMDLEKLAISGEAPWMRRFS